MTPPTPTPSTAPPTAPGTTPKSNFATWGIDEGTGFKNKLGKGVFNVAEGALNSIIAPLNPRWWYKAYSDIAGIKATDYGGGTSGKVLAVLSGMSQVAQKVGTVAGVLSLALGIAAACLGALMGAGAACALGSSVCGLISFIANGVAFVLQSVLVIGNLIKGAGSATGEQKKRLFADIAGLIGSGLGVIGGGLAVNWGGGQGLFNSGTHSVLDTATQGLASSGNLVGGQVTGATSVGSQVGQQFANAGMGQTFGSVSDSVSEGLGSIAAKHDPSIQRVPASPIVQREGDVDEVKDAINMFLSVLAPSRADDKKVENDMKSSIEAVDGTKKAMATPLSAVPGKSGAPDMTVEDGAAAAPGKIAQAEQAMDEAEAATEKKGKFHKKDTGKLDAAAEKVSAAEEKLGIQGEEPKKPSLFKRFKDWLISKVLNIKARLKKVMQAAKAKIVNFTMDVLGVSKEMGELKSAAATDRTANEAAMTGAQESTAAADVAEVKAKEFAAALGSK